MKKERWFIAVSLCQFIGLVVTLIASIPAGSLHHFIHEMILWLTFTNITGVGG